MFLTYFRAFEFLENIFQYYSRGIVCDDLGGERGGLVVESLTPEREVGSSIPTSTVLCP